MSRQGERIGGFRTFHHEEFIERCNKWGVKRVEQPGYREGADFFVLLNDGSRIGVWGGDRDVGLYFMEWVGEYV